MRVKNQKQNDLPSTHECSLQSEEEKWELIGSRTYNWEGSSVLRCRHWDEVAVRWHLSTCGSRHAKRHCEGGTNAHLATHAQEYHELPRWENAFTYVQLPTDIEHDHNQILHLGMDGYDNHVMNLTSITPLKIDVDWKWTKDKNDCNHFTVRMSAMSTIEKHRLGELEQFCRAFDKDGFVICDNL
ncbi:unnamed protein product [Auanema sp. JU1783]|nr:unnamed protein product [Auanema sp. JU1783]